MASRGPRFSASTTKARAFVPPVGPGRLSYLIKNFLFKSIQNITEFPTLRRLTEENDLSASEKKNTNQRHLGLM
jgi:hypothetical protein